MRRCRRQPEHFVQISHEARERGLGDRRRALEGQVDIREKLFGRSFFGVLVEAGNETKY